MYTARQFVETGKTAAKDPIVRQAAIFFLVVLLGVLFAGCRRTESISLPERQRILPHSGLRFTLLVTDQDLANAVNALAEDWFAQTDSKLVVLTASEQQIAQNRFQKTDGAILPSNLVGPLAERGLISPLSLDTLADSKPQWETIFARCRVPGALWDGKTVAVPFGGPVFTVYYRQDLFSKLGKEPPKTWDEYAALAAFFHDRNNLQNLVPPPPAPWSGTIEPLGRGWAGLILLARAAPYWDDAGAAASLFDPVTMEPRIAEPPMVRALTELGTARGSGPRHPETFNPDNTREAFWLGESAMALSWPTAAARLSGVPRSKVVAGFSELPGSSEYYDPAASTWAPREENQVANVPLLGVSGYVGVVFSSTLEPEGMTELLLWLAVNPSRSPPGTATTTTTLYHDSQVESARDWVEPLVTEAAALDYARLTQTTLNRDIWSAAPRIPGRREYLAALDEAVQAVLDGADPQEALDAAADQWRRITARFGLESQRKAYRAALALPDAAAESATDSTE